MTMEWASINSPYSTLLLLGWNREKNKWVETGSSKIYRARLKLNCSQAQLSEHRKSLKINDFNPLPFAFFSLSPTTKLMTISTAHTAYNMKHFVPKHVVPFVCDQLDRAKIFNLPGREREKIISSHHKWWDHYCVPFPYRLNTIWIKKEKVQTKAHNECGPSPELDIMKNCTRTGLSLEKEMIWGSFSRRRREQTTFFPLYVSTTKRKKNQNTTRNILLIVCLRWTRPRLESRRREKKSAAAARKRSH